MSLNSPFSSFSFFFLSFSLTWIKVSKPPDWGVLQCSFNKFNYWWNRIFTVSLFFGMLTTFQYLRIVEGKQFALYLSLTGFNFQISFSPFYGWVTFPGIGWIQHVVLMLASVQTKILLQISLMRDGLFGAKSL